MISVAEVVWAETFECEKDSKEASAAAVRMIANFFLNITQSLSSSEFPRTKFDANMITAIGRERIRGAPASRRAAAFILRALILLLRRSFGDDQLIVYADDA